MRYIDLCLQSVKVVILPMLTVFRIVAKCLCIDLKFFFGRVPQIIQRVTYQKRRERRYDIVFMTELSPSKQER